MKSEKTKVRIFTLCLFILTLIHTPFCIGKVIFEDDFEKNVIDKGKWIPTGSWSLEDGVLVVNGGEVGLSVKDDFTDFEFYVDFYMINPLWAANWVIRGEDPNNCTLLQIVADDRDQFWWFTRVEGNYFVHAEDQLKNESGIHPKLEKWYTVKIVAKGNIYELYLGEQGENLELSCKWKDDTTNEGSIGFRAGGGEHCLYDNVIVTTVGHSFPVDPKDALAVTWGELKEIE